MISMRLCLCSGEDEDQFEQFMLPLTAAFEAVAQMLSTNTFNEQEAKVKNQAELHGFPVLFSSDRFLLLWFL